VWTTAALQVIHLGWSSVVGCGMITVALTAVTHLSSASF
jgi:hypothetical protein